MRARHAQAEHQDNAQNAKRSPVLNFGAGGTRVEINAT
jgi:hypothetical protein